MAAVLSLTAPKPIAAPVNTDHHNHPQIRRRLLLSPHHRRPTHYRPISAAARIPSSLPPSPIGQVYQPFRPPPSPLPAKYLSLGPTERLEILRDRLGLWHEYAPLISSLAQDGFTPPSIEEATGISGVDQNRLIVAAQVRDSLLSAPSFDPLLLAQFDSEGGADLLCELRLLNAAQRAAAARRVAELRLDPKAAQELARAMKDFPRRRGDDGWARFDAGSPGDCLAYTRFRLSREATSAVDRAAALERAMEAAETEGARGRIAEEMERASGKVGVEVDDVAASVKVPVVRLKYGEVADSTTVALLPVCRAAEGEAELEAAPRWCKEEGALGVAAAEKTWGRWAVLPGWGAVTGVAERVAVEFGDARSLPWREKEAVLVVADRARREVAESDGFYLVGGGGEKRGLAVERGRKLLEKGVKEALGTVVLVVRPLKEDDNDQFNNEDWE